MHIDEISNLDFLVFLTVAGAIAWGVWRLVPSDDTPPARTRFTGRQIAGYDAALPKYFVTAFAAVAVAAIHAAVKSLPPVYAWLADAGRGGHLVRDIANTHLMIVVGGTVAATGLTWYVLPRVVGRPLVSTRLAGISFWCTALGAFGFYLTNVIMGIWSGSMEHAGASWAEAEAAMGAWRIVPIGLTATVMGVGYWTFVGNVIFTVVAAREVAEPPADRHLAKFFVVGALGLFAGTVQGVVQVLPDQEAWLHAAGPAGEYIDPIAHAHVNLVTGTLMLVGGLAFWASRSWLGVARAERRLENVAFWVLAVGSIAFYFVFLRLGFAEGRMMLAEGMPFEEAVDRMGWRHTVPLAATGSVTLAGLWLMIGTVASRFARRRDSLAGLVVAGAVALSVGTSQGLVQLVPAVKRWMEEAGAHGDAVANAHAQLNMLGGVLLTLTGLALLGSRPLLRVGLSAGVARRVLLCGAGGVAVYYAAAMTAALRGGTLANRVSRPAVDPLGDVIAPSGMAVGSALYAVAFGSLAALAWRASSEQRAELLHRLRHRVASRADRRPAWVDHVPWPAFVLGEVAAAGAGFPGIGWILAGRPMVGLPLALLAPAIAWGIIPSLQSVGRLSPGTLAPIAWLAVTTAVSAGLLAAVLARMVRRRAEAAA